MSRASCKRIAATIALALSAPFAANAADPPDYVKLASVDAGRVVASDSAQARRTKAAFQRAAGLCTAPNGLVNQVSFIRRELESKGVATSNTELLEGLAGVLLGAKPKPACAEILAMYAGIRTSGMPEMNTHTDAVLGMRGLARSGALGFAVDENLPKAVSR